MIHAKRAAELSCNFYDNEYGTAVIVAETKIIEATNRGETTASIENISMKTAEKLAIFLRRHGYTVTVSNINKVKLFIYWDKIED